MLFHGLAFRLRETKSMTRPPGEGSVDFPRAESLGAIQFFIRRWYVWHGVAWVSTIHFQPCMAWHGKRSSFEEEDV